MNYALRSRQLTERWFSLTFYQRFESLIALALTVIITLVILSALYHLTVGAVGGLLFGALDPLEHADFQIVFGQIMTVLIALEFNHTLQYVVTREQSIVQTKIVLLIALLAVARKFILLDMKETTALELFGLATITLALGITYWLMRDRDDRLRQAHEPPLPQPRPEHEVTG